MSNGIQIVLANQGPQGPPGPPGGNYYVWSPVNTTTILENTNAYIPTTDSTLPFILPTTAAVGDHYQIAGYGLGGWSIAQNAGQTIHFGNMDTTTGTGGSLASQNHYDCIEIVCAAANTDFVVIGSQGNITVT